MSEPATEKQIKYLSVFGYVQTGPLTRQEASELLSRFEEDPEHLEIRAENNALQMRRQMEFDSTHAAQVLHEIFAKAADELKHAQQGEITDAREEFKEATKQRITFWKDTFREPAESTGEWEQSFELFEQYGHRFKVPSTKQITEILAALDEKAPTWDTEFPHVFYQTMELNFPQLLR